MRPTPIWVTRIQSTSTWRMAGWVLNNPTTSFLWRFSCNSLHWVGSIFWQSSSVGLVDNCGWTTNGTFFKRSKFPCSWPITTSKLKIGCVIICITLRTAALMATTSTMVQIDPDERSTQRAALNSPVESNRVRNMVNEPA